VDVVVKQNKFAGVGTVDTAAAGNLAEDMSVLVASDMAFVVGHDGAAGLGNLALGY
jgi:hypothetical protein